MWQKRAITKLLHTHYQKWNVVVDYGISHRTVRRHISCTTTTTSTITTSFQVNLCSWFSLSFCLHVFQKGTSGPWRKRHRFTGPSLRVELEAFKVVHWHHGFSSTTDCWGKGIALFIQGLRRHLAQCRTAHVKQNTIYIYKYDCIYGTWQCIGMNEM